MSFFMKSLSFLSDSIIHRRLAHLNRIMSSSSFPSSHNPIFVARAENTSSPRPNPAPPPQPEPFGQIRHLSNLHFANTLTATLVPDAYTPGDPFTPPKTDTKFSHVARQVPKAHFSYVKPENCPDPILLSFNTALANEMGWDTDYLLSHADTRDELTQLFSGNKLFSNSNSWSLAYGGHQFGSWAGQLGDGRAISLGELQVTLQAMSSKRGYELQLKGAGLTPYSRFADGYAVLRSSIREYLCAEAMHSLGVPTSRSLSLIGSSRPVYREEKETGAIVCRVAPSWIRFGNFELFFARNDLENMEKLVQYTISYHFPHLYDENASETGSSLSEKISRHLYTRWLRDVCRKTAYMIAHWQAVGFCHGVMNTDNFSILGITIDYGPFQFLDIYESGYVCNHSDETGRYAFDEQPRVAMWNLARLCSVIHPLITAEFTEDGADDAVTQVLTSMLLTFPSMWESYYTHLMLRKLGISSQPPNLSSPDNRTEYEHDLNTLIRPLLHILEECQLDYTHFFRTFSRVSLIPESLSEDVFKNICSSSMLPAQSEQWPHIMTRFQEWFKEYRARAVGEDSPYTLEQDAARQGEMLDINPKYTLRNHLVNDVIDDVKKGDLRSLETYLKLLQHPFAEGSSEEETRFGGPVPAFSRGLKCSCSS